MQNAKTVIRSFAHDTRGSAMAVLGAGVVLTLGMASVAVDMGYLYIMQNQLQVTADSAALAGLARVPDVDQARTQATTFVESNMPSGKHGTVMAADDFKTGFWDDTARTFTDGGTPLNAVQVTVRRSQSNGNAARLFFGQLLGFNSLDLSATAVAAGSGVDCFGTGFKVKGSISLGQDANIGAGVCMYGGNGISFGQDGVIQDGGYVASPSLSNITGNPSHQSGALVEETMDTSAAANAADIIDDIEAGIDLPPQITNGVVTVGSIPSNPVPGTAYVINGNVTIGQDIVSTNNIFAVRGNISWGQDGKIRNSAGTCASGETAIGLVTTGNVSLGQDSLARGVQVVTAGNVTIGQDANFQGSSIIADGNLSFGQDVNLSTPSGCGGALGGATGGSAENRLVM